MKKPGISVAIILAVISVISFLGWLAWEHKKAEKKTALLMDTYRGPTLTISGRVIFPEYESGEITVFASRTYLGPPDISLTVIPRPGEYSLKAPQNFGEIYIIARNPKPADRLNKNITKPFGRYSNNPLKAGSFDIKGVNLVINSRPFMLMDFYPGPTVSISGRIIFPGYESGEISISVSSKDRVPADIALIIIPRPGEYTFRVPRNFGNLYLQAKNFNSTGPEKLNSRVGRYKEDFIKIGPGDIQGVDIIF